MAGVLATVRRGEDLVVTILGGPTRASFAVGVALSTPPAMKSDGLSSATIFAALLFGVLAFRGAFVRRSAHQ